MEHRYPRGALTSSLKIGSLVTLAAVLFVGVDALMPFEANAAAPYSGHYSDGWGWPKQIIGNGKFNRNSVLANSPATSNDVQHLRNANNGGINISGIAMCRRRLRHCKIVQRSVVFVP